MKSISEIEILQLASSYLDDRVYHCYDKNSAQKAIKKLIKKGFLVEHLERYPALAVHGGAAHRTVLEYRITKLGRAFLKMVGK